MNKYTCDLSATERARKYLNKLEKSKFYCSKSKPELFYKSKHGYFLHLNCNVNELEWEKVLRKNTLTVLDFYNLEDVPNDLCKIRDERFIFNGEPVKLYRLSLERQFPSEIVNSLEEKDYNDVEKPEHYANSSIECYDALKAALIKEELIGFLKGQVFKYFWRMGKKQNNTAIKDVSKAIWYANKLKELLESE